MRHETIDIQFTLKLGEFFGDKHHFWVIMVLLFSKRFSERLEGFSSTLVNDSMAFSSLNPSRRLDLGWFLQKTRPESLGGLLVSKTWVAKHSAFGSLRNLRSEKRADQHWKFLRKNPSRIEQIEVSQVLVDDWTHWKFWNIWLKRW